MRSAATRARYELLTRMHPDRVLHLACRRLLVHHCVKLVSRRPHVLQRRIPCGTRLRLFRGGGLRSPPLRGRLGRLARVILKQEVHSCCVACAT